MDDVDRAASFTGRFVRSWKVIHVRFVVRVTVRKCVEGAEPVRRAALPRAARLLPGAPANSPKTFGDTTPP